jgi:hypothetical protein
MAAISLPERGQPLDVNYIYEMVSQINSIENRIAIRNTSVSTINNNTDTTSNLKFYAEQKALITSEAKANTTETITFTYPRFKFTPVVTATVLNDGGSTSGDDVICTVRNLTTSTAAVVVRFNSPGKVDLFVNLIAIGVPV